MFRAGGIPIRKALAWLASIPRRVTVPVLGIIFCTTVAAAYLYGAHHPTDQHAQNHAKTVQSQQCSQGTFWQRTTCDPVALFTGVLALFSGLLTVTTFIQIAFLIRADKTARIAADATKRGADAAFASLDRPWLFLGTPIVNYVTWLEGKSRLEAAICLSNYGKAPAFVHGIKGLVFISPARQLRQDKIPFDLGTIDAVEFPRESELAEFKKRRLRAPDLREQPFEIDWRGITKTQFTVMTAEYLVPFVVSGGENSAWYLIRGKPPIADLPLEGQAIPLQGMIDVYLMGRILYSGPDEEFHVIDFCYEKGGDWRMRPYMGRPYNQRYKLNEQSG